MDNLKTKLLLLSGKRKVYRSMLSMFTQFILFLFFMFKTLYFYLLISCDVIEFKE